MRAVSPETEGTAFFIEAIAIGFFLYGWEKFNKWFHWFCGVVVGVSGLASGILVLMAVVIVGLKKNERIFLSKIFFKIKQKVLH